jgi:hypothetical protein
MAIPNYFAFDPDTALPIEVCLPLYLKLHLPQQVIVILPPALAIMLVHYTPHVPLAHTRPIPIP